MIRLPLIDVHTPWDCRWTRLGKPARRISRHGSRQEQRDQDPAWVCVRNGGRRSVADEECESCEHWEPNGTE